MQRKTLHNYLLTYRKRAGLSQSDLAFLFGCESSAKVTRYERSVREPNLRAALTYEAIFGASVRELFAGVYSEVEAETSKRAAELSRKIQEEKPDRFTKRKLEFLRIMMVARGVLSENE